MEAAIDCTLVKGLLGGGKIAVRMCDESDARDLQRVKQEELCIAMGVFAEVRIWLPVLQPRW